MKFSVKTTLKASSLAGLGTIGPGIYDTESPNFPAALKEVLIAEVEDPRGLVVCIDPEDRLNIPEPVLADVSTETLDDISSGEGKAEEDLHDTEPPLGAQAAATTAEKSAPSPTKPAKPRRITTKK